MKKIISLVLSVTLIAALFAGCSGKKEEKYSDTTLIIGYTQAVAPFLEVDRDGNATGFCADLWAAIFDSVKGDCKDYCFEKIDEGYMLEDDGGFTDSKGKEYSAGLIMGAVAKNQGTFNEDYSFTEPIITNRVITITKKGSNIKRYKDLAGAKALVVGDTAKAALEKNYAVASACASVGMSDLDKALAALDGGTADAVIVDEFTLMPSDKAANYDVIKGELDTIEYVIACAKYSGWKDSINEAIFEYKSPEYNKNGDEFTPLVEKYFGYNASSFDYKSEAEK